MKQEYALYRFSSKGDAPWSRVEFKVSSILSAKTRANRLSEAPFFGYGRTESALLVRLDSPGAWFRVVKSKKWMPLWDGETPPMSVDELREAAHSLDRVRSAGAWDKSRGVEVIDWEGGLAEGHRSMPRAHRYVLAHDLFHPYYRGQWQTTMEGYEFLEAHGLPIPFSRAPTMSKVA